MMLVGLLLIYPVSTLGCLMRGCQLPALLAFVVAMESVFAVIVTALK